MERIGAGGGMMGENGYTLVEVVVFFGVVSVVGIGLWLIVGIGRLIWSLA